MTKNDFLDNRNVADKYKGMSTEDIQKDVRANAFPYAVLMENTCYDFNFASLVRNANGFGCSKVFYMSPKKKFDPRGCVGTHHYTDITHISSLEQLKELQSKYVFIGVEQAPDAIPYFNLTVPYNALYIFGNELAGISEPLLEKCHKKIYIPMFGSVRSFNVASTAAVIMANHLNS